MPQPVIIDSHAHLDYPQLAADLPGVLARAEDAGVSQIISIGVKLSTSYAPREIAEAHDNVWFSACLLYTSPSPRDGLLSRMPSSA